MDTKVLIQRGQLLMGGLCKRTVGNAAGGLIHIIWKDYGPDSCRRFLSSAQVLVNSWLIYNGFTVGIADTISDEATSKEIMKELQMSKEKVQKIMQDAQEGKLECQPGKNMLETFEYNINIELNAARDKAGKLAMQSLSDSNNVKMMVQSGSKGTDINISQIMSCVGQQNVEGKRVPFGFKNRTLPHFNKDDYGPESRGFVQNSYLSGLNPQEFYFHAMGGREGLIDTAVKTSETGYIQRRLIKALEDVMVKYDGTVRNSMGYLLQFLYGEDGMAGESIEDQNISILNKDDKEMSNMYQLLDPQKNQVEELSKLKDVLEPAIADELANDAEMQYKLQKSYEDLLECRNELRRDVFRNGQEKQHLPVNLERLITTAKRNFHLENNKISDLNPITVIEELNKLVQKLVVVPGNDHVSVEAQMNGIRLFTIHLKSELAPKKLICFEKLNKASFDWLVGEIENRFNQALIPPGEMVGAIAAQSIGEPATQMTLNTFHFAGVSSKNVTLGVPHLKEMMNVAKTIKTPTTTVFLLPEISSNKERTEKVRSLLEHTTLSHVAKSSQIFYDPDIKHSIVEEDNQLLTVYYEFDEPDPNISPWLLRIELSHDKMTETKLGMLDIQRKIMSSYEGHLELMATDDNAPNLVLRIRTLNKDGHEESKRDNYSALNNLKTLQSSLMNDLLIKGIPEIKKVYMRRLKKFSYDKSKQADEWIMETDGVNLKQVLLVDNIDPTRTYSNSIIEIADVLGIEAVRQCILRELRMVLDVYSIYVNYRHLSMLIDLMTHRGTLTSITRHGINRVESGPLRRCSFEETVEILLEAAVFSEVDHLKGITENIIMGQLCPLGTGSFDILIDTTTLSQAKHISDPYEVAHLEDERDELMTPLQNSPSSQTPFLRTPAPLGGATPRTPTEAATPYRDAGRSFSPSYDMRFASPGYPTSPVYNSEYIQSPSSPKQQDKYSPGSPPHPINAGVVSNQASPQYAGSVASPPYTPGVAMEYSPGNPSSPNVQPGGGYSPNPSKAGLGMLAGAMRNHLSPMYSPNNGNHITV